MDLIAHERTQLAGIFACTDAQLDAKIEQYSRAATEEYVRMILGQRVFTRGQDVREYRLYLLIKFVFESTLPTEQQISDLFQTTTTQSRALLRAVMSKYQYELQDAISGTLGTVIASATRDMKTDIWSFTVDSENLIEALNRRLVAINGSLQQVVRARNTITRYEITNASYSALFRGVLRALLANAEADGSSPGKWIIEVQSPDFIDLVDDEINLLSANLPQTKHLSGVLYQLDDSAYAELKATI